MSLYYSANEVLRSEIFQNRPNVTFTNNAYKMFSFNTHIPKNCNLISYETILTAEHRQFIKMFCIRLWHLAAAEIYNPIAGGWRLNKRGLRITFMEVNGFRKFSARSSLSRYRSRSALTKLLAINVSWFCRTVPVTLHEIWHLMARTFLKNFNLVIVQNLALVISTMKYVMKTRFL